jgi:hypothetical protein
VVQLSIVRDADLNCKLRDFKVAFELANLTQPTLLSLHSSLTTTIHRFVHFEPIGHSLEHGYDHTKHDPNQKSGYNHGLPPYILDGSIEASRYRHKHGTSEWKPFHYEAEDMPEVTGSNGAHYAAYSNNIETLLHILANERGEMVHEPDGNGWLPIHEVSFVQLLFLDLYHYADT